jgi:hypothetical protein
MIQRPDDPTSPETPIAKQPDKQREPVIIRGVPVKIEQDEPETETEQEPEEPPS